MNRMCADTSKYGQVRPIPTRRNPDPALQRGMALVMALVMLMILTILGITAMTTSSLEEKMSGNIQESTRAFEAAESGINSAVGTAGLLNPNTSSAAPVTRNYDYDGKKSGSAAVEAWFREYTPPGRSKNPSEIYSATNLQEAHFNVKSTGTTLTNARSVHHQGIAQVVSKSD